MKNILSDLAYDITQTIKGSGRVIMMYDEDGNRTYDQREAVKIFAYPDKMMVIITDDGIDSSVDVGLSQSTDVIKLQDFITTLRHLCTNYNVLFNINKYGKEITPKDFANYNTSSDLSECLEYYNKNRVDELFKDDSDVEIEKLDNMTYRFSIDNNTYYVEVQEREIAFSLQEGFVTKFRPIKLGKNQFIVLNTVLKCIKFIFEDNTGDYYYFSGNIKNGLSKLYSIMFDKLKNNAINYGYIPLSTKEYNWNMVDDCWDKEPNDFYWYFVNPNTQKGKELIEKAKEQDLPFVNQLNENKQRTDELFKDDSDVEIEKLDNSAYQFQIDNELYLVELEKNNITFENSKAGFSPTKNNKNQFLVLNTVIRCIELIFKNSNLSYYHFSGDKNNGLAKLYGIMFNKLKNNAISYGYIPLSTKEYNYYNWDNCWHKQQTVFNWYFINPNTQKGKELIEKAREQDLLFVNQLNENKQRTDELFKGDNSYEYKEITDGHFVFYDSNNEEYFVDIEYEYSENLSFLDDYLQERSEDISWKEISYYKSNTNGNPYAPTKSNNGTQFKVLSTVIKIITDYISNDTEHCFYFTGDRSYGLAKIYSTIFNNIQTNGTNLFKKEFHFSDEILFCLIQKDLLSNKQRTDELFNADSDIKIKKGNNEYSFVIDDNEYNVYYNKDTHEFSFSHITKTNRELLSPVQNNKNQFLILNTVLTCLKDIISANNIDYLYFSGNKNNGLAKLYSIMFNKLKNNIPSNYTSVCSDSYMYDRYESTWENELYDLYWYIFDKNSEKAKEIIMIAKKQDLPFANQLIESKLNELFTNDSNVKIEEMLGTYYFTINNINYEVYVNYSEILFAISNTEYSRFDPIKNNKNQFLVLNTLVKCVEQILKTKEIYYFSGNNENGLGKLYSTMFNRLKNKVIEMGYIALDCGEYHFDEDSLFDENYKPFNKTNGDKYFWFIPKEMMTEYVYNEAKKLDINVFGNKSSINESLYGSKKSSYEKDGKCKLILRHSKTIDENKRNSRTRNIEKIFLETDEGERIKCPVNNLKGARAWAKYVNKNGIIEDENTDRLFSLVEDLQYMKNLKKHLFKQRNNLDESTYKDEVYGISEGIIKLTKMLNSAARTGKIPEIQDCELEQELNEIYVFEDEELLEKAKRAKRRQQSLLAPVIQSEDIEMTETPFTKYAKKWLENNNKETSEKSINGLAEGLKEIVNDDVDYTIDFDPNDDEGNNIREFAENISCPYTKDYVLCLADKVKNGDELGKVEKQILRHIVNGVDSDENLNEFVEPEKEESPRKEIPNIGDQVATDYGPGTVVGKEGFNLDIELQNGKMIEANAFNVDITYRPGKGEIEEMSILESFFKQF